MLASVPGVEAAAVALRDGMLLACLVPDDPQLIERARAVASESLPQYMLPSAFVTVAQLPLNNNGKLDVAALPQPRSRLTDASLSEPLTPNQQILIDIWAELLGRQSVHVLDNFFQLGGDSILAVSAVGRARQRGLRLTLQDFFSRPTVVQLAAVAVSQLPAQRLMPKPGTRIPLTPVQALFFAAQQRPNPDHFNQSLLLACTQLDRRLLTRALQILVDFHDAFGLRFENSAESGWQQTYQPQSVQVEELPLESLSAEVDRIQRSLNITNGPLYRVVLFTAAGQAIQRLLLVFHHLVIDAVSFRVLVKQLSEFYHHLLTGTTPQPSLTSTYFDWSRGLAVAERLEQLDFWRQQLSSPPLFSASTVSTDSLATARLTLAPRLTEQLLGPANRTFRTQPNELVLAGLLSALARLTGRHQASLFLEGHGRESLTEGTYDETVGWFTSVFPVQFNLQRKVRELICGVKERLRTLPDRGASYALIRQHAGTETTKELAKLEENLQVCFNYLGASPLGVWPPAAEVRGLEASSSLLTHLVLDFNVSVEGDSLVLDVGYNSALLPAIDAFLASLQASLRELAEACLAAETAWTPSDFPFAGLAQDQLDRLTVTVPDLERVYKLTPLQQGLLFHALHSPASDQYCVQVRETWDGQVEAEQYKAAWLAVFGQQPALRTTFVWAGLDEPVQVVRRSPAFYWSERQLPDESQAASEALAQVTKEERDAVTLAEPLRVCLLQFGGRRSGFLLSVHHILLDGWSTSKVLLDVARVYNGARPSIPELSFEDFVGWQQKPLSVSQREFWQAQLAGAEALELGLALQTPDVHKPLQSVSSLSLSLEPSLMSRLAHVRQQHGLTLHSLLQFAFALLCSRFSRTTDVLFGTTLSGRAAGLPGVDGVVGLLINTVPIRVQFSTQDTALSAIQATQRLLSQLNEHGQLSLAQLQQLSGLPTLFDVLFVFDNYMTDTRLRGLTAVDSVYFEKTNYPLSVVCTHASQADRLEIRGAWDPTVYDEASVRLLLTCLRDVLDSICRAPETRLQDVTFGGEAPLAQPLPGLETSLVALWSERVAASPDAPFLTFEGETLSYRAVDALANGVAAALVTAGLAVGELVLLITPIGIATVFSLLGILKAGGAYVPVDVKTPAARRQFVSEDTKARFLVTTQNLVDQLDWAGTTIVAENCPPQALFNPPLIPATSLAYVIYTSGSTGQPKGVLVEHRNVASLLEHTLPLFPFHNTDAWTLFHSHVFDFSVWELWGPIRTGARLVVVPEAARLSSSELYNLVQTERVTVLNLTPSVFYPFEAVDASKPGESLPLRVLIFGGEALTVAKLSGWLARRPDCRTVNMYGITETTVHVTYQLVGRSLRRNLIGQPLPHLTVLVADEHGRPNAAGVPGELWVGGAGVTRGYLNRPDLTPVLRFSLLEIQLSQHRFCLLLPV